MEHGMERKHRTGGGSVVGWGMARAFPNYCTTFCCNWQSKLFIEWHHLHSLVINSEPYYALKCQQQRQAQSEGGCQGTALTAAR